MTKEQIKELFITFLGVNNIYFRMISIIDKSPYKTFDEFIEINPEDFFHQFIWAASKEGVLYWQRINSTWCSFLKQNGYNLL